MSYRFHNINYVKAVCASFELKSMHPEYRTKQF